jgi:phenylpropionate dioxygenase-like ring-hydroxylating dioxygenase large terminal subunit
MTPRTPLEKFPEPDLGTARIPKDRYTSPEFARLEWERMWTRTWQCAGPVSDLAEPGDYLTYEIGTESILVTRHGTGAGDIAAFFNVCQHRASQIRQPGVGHARQLVCPYHLWAYDLEGRLVDVPDRDDFPQGIPDGMCLPRVRAEVWGGWVWVNLDPDAAPLAEFLGVVADHLAPYDFGRHYHLVEDITFEWECNWKIGVDAFNEVYHVQGIHPELLEFTDDVDCPIDLFGLHSRFLFHVGYPSPRWTDALARSRGYADASEIPDPLRDIMERLGLDPEAYDGDLKGIRRLLIARMRELAPQIGFDYSDLQDDQLWLDVHYTIFPNITLNISPDHFWWFRHRPHPTDPNRMYWDFHEYRRVPAGQPVPERPEHLHAVWGDGTEQKLHLALQQDGWAAPPLQRGIRSQGYQGLWLAHQERRIRHFHHVLDGYLARP